MSTIKEVAASAKVSTATVSYVINGSARVSPLLRKRVLAAVRQLDYRPNYVAQSLRNRRTHMLGIVVTDITDPFFAQIIRGAADAASKHGYLLTIFNTDDVIEREEQVFSMLRARRMDGILWVPAFGRKARTQLKKALEDGIPVVSLARVLRGVPLDSVVVRNREGARECVLHLINAGNRRIALIGGPKGVSPARDRVQGYLDAMRQCHLPVDAALMREGDFRAGSGYRIGKELLSAFEPPTAFFVANGMMTVGLLRALDELGLHCPEDAALATFGDLEVAEYLYPHVTVAAQPSYELGRQGAELVLQRIRGELRNKRHVSIQLSAKLEVKESSSLQSQPDLVAQD